MRALTIGVNALYMIPGGVGGTEIYLRSLLAALARLDSPHRFVVFINRETASTLPAPGPAFEIVQTGVHATNRPARLAWEQLAFPRELRRHRIDVLFNPGFTAPAFAPCPSVTVFHDLQHVRHPEHFRWFDLPFWRAFLYASARRSAQIIAVSEATRQDFLAHYHANASRVHVVHHGVDPEFFFLRQRRGPTQPPYILAVSTLHPHKNFERLLQAFAQFQKSGRQSKLIIVGLRGFAAAAIEKLVSDLKLHETVDCTGWIPREELYDLFAGAGALVYPTTFEGFGMPLLEGMAAGLPVACSDIEPLRTIAAGAALLFDPSDTGAIEQALVRITEDQRLRTQLREAGPRRASEFTWEEAARQTLRILAAAA